MLKAINLETNTGICIRTLKMGLPFDSSNSTSNNLLSENNFLNKDSLCIITTSTHQVNKPNQQCEC